MKKVTINEVEGNWNVWVYLGNDNIVDSFFFKTLDEALSYIKKTLEKSDETPD